MLRPTNIKSNKIQNLPLKVQSPEMDPAETRFLRKAFIQERGAEVFRKIHLSPILWEPLKIPRHFVQLLEVWKRIAQAGMKFIAP
jgi:hypothetical protein